MNVLKIMGDVETGHVYQWAMGNLFVVVTRATMILVVHALVCVTDKEKDRGEFNLFICLFLFIIRY